MASFDSLSAELPTDSKLLVLRNLKNSLIGHRERKLQLIRSGSLPHVVELASGEGVVTREEQLAIRTEVVTIIGAVSMPTPEAIHAILLTSADTMLAQSLEAELSHPLPSPTSRKLVEAIVRTMKLLYTDIVSVVGPRTWGTSIIGRTFGEGLTDDVGRPWERKEKGKERDVDMEGGEDDSEFASRLRTLADNAMVTLYGAKAYRGEAIPSTLPKLLLELLRQCRPSSSADSWFVTPSNRVQLADNILLLFGGTLRRPDQLILELVDEWYVQEEGQALFGLLWSFMHFETVKLQESALSVITALHRWSPPKRTGFPVHKCYQPLITSPTGEATNMLLPDLLAPLLRSPRPSLRLGAAACFTTLHKVKMIPHGLPALLVLLSLLQTDPSLQNQTTFILTYLISDDTLLQEAAIAHKCLPILRYVLSQPLHVDLPYATPASLDEEGRTREGALLCIACLVATNEAYRHQVIAASLLPTIIASLSHPSAGVRAAACHAIRGLSRSPSILRVSLTDIAAAGPIYRLLAEGEDQVVAIAGAALVANLLIEFSPLREALLEAGCIARLCALVRSEVGVVRMNALWALKNATYQSKSAFKRSMMIELSWDYLTELITRWDSATTVQALAILRNITCTYDDEPVTAMEEMGEERMFQLLEMSLRLRDEDDVNLQALFVVVNLATCSETTRLAIMSRDDLLKCIIEYLAHPNNELRSAAVWTIINLAHQGRTNGRLRRRPHEILAKLRYEVEDKLKAMVSDPSIEVRDRVKDALEAIGTTV